MKLKSKLLYLLYPFAALALLVLGLALLFGIVLSQNTDAVLDLIEKWDNTWGM